MLIMEMKPKCLDLNTKLEVIHLSEFRGLSKSEIGRWYGLPL
jgi:hypothetical protein